MKIYISGAIAGHDRQAVRDKFADAAQVIAAQGNEPLNPLDNGLPPSASWEHHMRADIAMMMYAETVAMLPCWRTSRGAIVEFGLANTLGIPITYL